MSYFVLTNEIIRWMENITEIVTKKIEHAGNNGQYWDFNIKIKKGIN